VYSLIASELFIKQLDGLDRGVKEQIKKKLDKIKTDKKRRHLKLGLPYFVEEIGQYRIIYSANEEKQELLLMFVGRHKDYEKYYASLF
jgi:mRNA-degrading endonuclease RelE of RelBE toxin-antitoxin system